MIHYKSSHTHTTVNNTCKSTQKPGHIGGITRELYVQQTNRELICFHTHSYSETPDVIWSFQGCTRCQVQHSTQGEMISDPGNHSFNYIFCSPSFSFSLSSLPYLPLDQSLLGFSLWPDVCHFAILLMASSLPLSV